MDDKETYRGSAKLFTLDPRDPRDHEQLSEALGLARVHYEVKAWWKTGLAAVDFIRGSLEVPSTELGPAISGLMHLNDAQVFVTAECFPYGVPQIEAFRVDVDIRRGS